MSEKKEPREPVPNVPEYGIWVYLFIIMVGLVALFLRCSLVPERAQ